MTMGRNGSLTFLNAGLDAARTTPPSAGGLVANNTDTGGGFERVLTTSDLASLLTTFTSPLTVLTGNTNAVITEPHSLGGLPDIVQLVLECTSGEHGYSIGDQVVMNTTQNELDEGASVAQCYNMVAYDGTNIYFTIGFEAGGGALGTQVPDRSSPGIPALATPASWSMLVKAIKF
jgi:hypothetical protein